MLSRIACEIRRCLASGYHQFFPLIKGYYWRDEYRTLSMLQWQDPATIRVHQQGLLRQALNSWYLKLPFYRRALDARSEQIGRSVSSLFDEMVERLELIHLPFMSKRDFMENADEIRYPDLNKTLLRSNSTGGSTGTSFSFLQNHIDYRWSVATMALHRDFIGIPLAEKSAKIWGASIEAAKAQRLRTNFAYWLANTRFISTYHLDESRIDKIVDILITENPMLLVGYPTSISVFAERLRERRAKIPNLRAVWSASETLFEPVRRQLEEDLGVPVYNNYGSREFGGLAMECEAHQGLHMNEGCFLFEYKPVSDNLYSLVVTDLHNRAQPLIRYEIGDLVRPSNEACSCGRGHTLIKHVEGRTFDLIRGQNGEVITGTFWTLTLRSKPGVKQFQVIQEELDRIRIKLIVDEEFTDVYRKSFERLIQQQFKLPITLLWEIVDEIPCMPSGKFRFIISQLKQV